MENVDRRTKTSHRPLTFEQVAELRELFVFFAERPAEPKPEELKRSAVAASASAGGAGGATSGAGAAGANANAKGGANGGAAGGEFFATVPGSGSGAGTKTGAAAATTTGTAASAAAANTNGNGATATNKPNDAGAASSSGELKRSAVAAEGVTAGPAGPGGDDTTAATAGMAAPTAGEADTKLDHKHSDTPPPQPPQNAVVVNVAPAASNVDSKHSQTLVPPIPLASAVEAKLAANANANNTLTVPNSTRGGAGNVPPAPPNTAAASDGKTKRSARAVAAAAATARRTIRPDLRITPVSIRAILQAIGLEYSLDKCKEIFIKHKLDPRGMLFEEFVRWFAEQLCGAWTLEDSIGGGAGAIKRRSDGRDPTPDEWSTIHTLPGVAGGSSFPSTSADLNEVYRWLDDSHDGAVSVRKLRHVFKALEPELSNDEMTELFKPLTAEHSHPPGAGTGTHTTTPPAVAAAATTAGVHTLTGSHGHAAETGSGGGSHRGATHTAHTASHHHHPPHVLSFEEFANFLFA